MYKVMHTKFTILVAGILLLFMPALLPLTAQPDNVYRTETFRTGNAPSLSAATSGGNITIERHDRDEVVIHVIARRAGRYLSPGDDLSQYADLTFEQNGDEVSVSARNRNRSGFSLFGSSGGNVSVSYHIMAPAGSSAEATTSGGNISLRGLNGTQNLRTSGGNVSLTDASGSLSASTSGGNIEARGVSGELDASTSGGRITLSNSSGNLRVRTSGGNISIRDSNGTISASTSGGNITASIAEPGESVNLTTSGGNVSLNLPASLTAADSPGLTLNLRGSSANMQGTLRGEMQNSDISRNRISGRFGAGASEITLRTSGGRTTLTFE